MTFAEYWLRLTDKNAGLRDVDSKMTISVASFRKAIEQSFEIGRESGRDRAEATKSVFDRMFGDRGL